MFRSIEDGASGRLVTIEVDGVVLQVREGRSLALALLECEVRTFRRSPVGGEPRAPMCLMGVCFECLVEVDGRRNVQACMVAVREGLSVRLRPEGSQEPRR